jgi:hypothetical protein
MMGFIMGIVTSILVVLVWRFVLPIALVLAILTGAVICDAETI